MIKTKLIAVTNPVVEGIEDAKDLLAFCARISNPSNQFNMDTADKLVSYLLKYKHFSPFEMVNCVVEVEAPRDIARQLLRHRSFAFQEFCIAGDSKITLVNKCGKSYKLPIEDLYKRYSNKQYWEMSDNFVRLYDEESGTFNPVKIKEVFNTGVKPVYNLLLDNGRQIKATLEHKFLTKNGFKVLADITKEDFIACNGIKCYQQYTWMVEAKQRNIKNGKGLQGIADDANVSYHTIRKWLKTLDLSFSKKEVAEYTTAWNKGLPKEEQPRYGKTVSDDTRLKMVNSSIKGKNSNLYKDGYRSWRKEVADFWNKQERKLFLECEGYCAIRGIKYEEDDLEIDHIQQVALFPELAYEPNNVQLIHKDEHKLKTILERPIVLNVPSYHKVVSVEFVGDEPTYDIEVEHYSHNYVANGIVTHNSQRYADVTALGDSFVIREARMQDTKNRQNSIALSDNSLKDQWEVKQQEILALVKEHYEWAISNNIAKECARVILPEGLTMSRLYVNGTIRSWLHYVEVRTEEGVTQQEHVELARLIAKVIAEAFPQITNFVKEPT